MTIRPHIFTFYSYKGGVGRSMALLNVAYTLHSLGRHVLMVDLDLEAPGVSGFLRRNDELEDIDEDGPDVVDLLSDLMPALKWELDEENRPELPVLEKYLRSVREDGSKYAPARNPRFNRTRLDVLSASDERDYAARLGALDLASLSGDDLVSTGNLLREIFFNHEFPWSWDSSEQEQSTRYDYILIDSRTGFTETSGLCIGPLADRLVLFCGLNDQNIHGTAEFTKVVGLTPSSKGIKWDDDDPDDQTNAPSLGEKPTLLVASPVPFGEMEMKAGRFKKMEEILGTAPDARISYHPRLSIIETVFCRDGAAESIHLEYQEITNRLLFMVGDNPTQWERRSEVYGRKVTLDTFTIKRMASLMDANGLIRIGSSHSFVADRLVELALEETGKEADKFFADAMKQFQAALTYKPDDHHTLTNWGTALVAQAKQKTGDEADALFLSALEKYKAALAIKPKNTDILNSWGAALSDQANQKTGNEADAFFLSAGEKFEEALSIKPDKHEVLNNWGATLSDQAKQKNGREADELFLLAEEKFKAALDIKPDKHETLYNWGSALSDQAKQKTGREADALFNAAGDKYEEAHRIKPDRYDLLHLWGVSLSEHAKQNTGAEADALFCAAAEKFQAALAIKPDDHELSYNMACLSSLKSDVDLCIASLTRAMKHGRGTTKTEIDNEKDFDPVRNDPAFVAFRDTLPR